MEDVITTAIVEALEKLGIAPVDFVVEHPADTAHGDYACNIAMVLSKSLGKSPRMIAEEIIEVVTGEIEYVERITIAGPGFINFYLARDFFTAETARIIALGKTWGHNDVLRGKTIVIEYTSPNLFKPLHIGNLVGNIIGESFTRLFEMSGATVKRFNYPSDIGLTVAKGVWGLKKLNSDPGDITALGEAYRTGNDAYEAGGSDAEEIKAVNIALYQNSDAELSRLRAAGIATSRTHLNELLRQLGTTFDVEITESEASVPGTTIVRAATGTIFKESDGAVVYEGEKVGLHTRVFLNSKGLPTYEAKDIGHFTLKQEAEPDWDHSVIVTGNEQAEYFKVVFAALRELFPEIGERVLEHIPTGFLTLTTGKMSSRKGNVLTGESLLADLQDAAKDRAVAPRTDDVDVLSEEIAVAALKYQILKHGVGSNIVFDKEKALSFEGDSGPYLQYTYARIGSVLEKAATVGLSPSWKHVPEVPYAVERVLYRFEAVVASALAERAPQQVVVYLTELAGLFNTFYAHEKIADVTDEYAPYKMAVAQAVAVTLKNGLRALGIKTPERL